MESPSDKAAENGMAGSAKVDHYGAQYGNFATRENATEERIAVTTDSFSLTEWDTRTLGKADILAMLESAAHEVSICIQSYNPTPLSTIRESLVEFDARRRQPAQQLEPA